jgi:hypothetical protein
MQASPTADAGVSIRFCSRVSNGGVKGGLTTPIAPSGPFFGPGMLVVNARFAVARSHSLGLKPASSSRSVGPQSFSFLPFSSWTGAGGL